MTSLSILSSAGQKQAQFCQFEAKYARDYKKHSQNASVHVYEEMKR